MSQVATSGEGANRGARVMAGIPYFVNGSNLYRLNSDPPWTIWARFRALAGCQCRTTEPSCASWCRGRGVYIHRAFHAHCDFGPGFHHQRQPQQVTFVDGYFVFTTDAKKIHSLRDQ